MTHYGAVVGTLESAYRDEGMGADWDSVKSYLMPGLTILGAVNGKWDSHETLPEGEKWDAEKHGDDSLHALICWNGDIVFDPSPGRSDGVGEWRDVTIFTVKDPQKLVRLNEYRGFGFDTAENS